MHVHACSAMRQLVYNPNLELQTRTVNALVIKLYWKLVNTCTHSRSVPYFLLFFAHKNGTWWTSERKKKGKRDKKRRWRVIHLHLQKAKAKQYKYLNLYLGNIKNTPSFATSSSWWWFKDYCLLYHLIQNRRTQPFGSLSLNHACSIKNPGKMIQGLRLYDRLNFQIEIMESKSHLNYKVGCKWHASN